MHTVHDPDLRRQLFAELQVMLERRCKSPWSDSGAEHLPEVASKALQEHCEDLRCSLQQGVDSFSVMAQLTGRFRTEIGYSLCWNSATLARSMTLIDRSCWIYS